MHSAIALASPPSDLPRDPLRDAPAGRPRKATSATPSPREGGAALSSTASIVAGATPGLIAPDLRPQLRPPLHLTVSEPRVVSRDPQQRMLDVMRTIRDIIQPAAKQAQADVEEIVQSIE